MANKQDGLVTRLSRTRKVVLQDGVETIIKPVPDADVTGDLDPRVLAVIQGYDATEPETSFDLTSARASMGWPNRDVTRMDIATDLVMIPSADSDIPARLYRPRTEEALPAIVFFHGGGFFGGTLDTVENPCKLLAEKANALVVSVDYRLAPEHPFPAGLNDCYRAVEWVYRIERVTGSHRGRGRQCRWELGDGLLSARSLERVEPDSLSSARLSGRQSRIDPDRRL